MQSPPDLVKKNIPFVIWLTGYSGAGKSTLATALKEELSKYSLVCTVLDGDALRTGLNRDLGFSSEDRKENNRRIVEVAKILIELGIIVIVATISPYEEDRNFARSSFQPRNFFLCYVKCPLEVCISRDIKGLYARAKAGNIPEFTGIDSLYEEPKAPDMRIETSKTPKDQCVNSILEYVNRQLGIIENNG